MIAIIPAAGHGTRFAPFTKLIPKEMLPIGARPAIALIVDEAVEAGADEVVIVTSPEKPLLKRWFEIEPPKVKLTWVDQLEQRGLGHAILQASAAVSGRSDRVLVLLGDALVSGGNASAAMREVSRAHGGASVIGCEHVPPEKVSRYGILKPQRGRDIPVASEAEGDIRIVDLVEKPAPEEAPSDLAVAGRYLLDASIFDYLKTQAPGKGGEIQLTDAIRRMITDPAHELYAYPYPGHRHDIGNPEGYLKALAALSEVEV